MVVVRHCLTVLTSAGGDSNHVQMPRRAMPIRPHPQRLQAPQLVQPQREVVHTAFITITFILIHPHWKSRHSQPGAKNTHKLPCQQSSPLTSAGGYDNHVQMPRRAMLIRPHPQRLQVPQLVQPQWEVVDAAPLEGVDGRVYERLGAAAAALALDLNVDAGICAGIPVM